MPRWQGQEFQSIDTLRSLKALNTTDPKEKTRLYTDAQQRIWKDAPWAFLVTEQLLSAHAKNLTGFHVMPDASFNFDEVDLK